MFLRRTRRVVSYTRTWFFVCLVFVYIVLMFKVSLPNAPPVDVFTCNFNKIGRLRLFKTYKNEDQHMVLLLGAMKDIRSSFLHHIEHFLCKVYFGNGVAYDFYSTDELHNHSGPGLQWLRFPLPGEQHLSNITPWTPSSVAEKVKVSGNFVSRVGSGLAFVDRVYIVTTVNLTDRHANLRRTFAQYKITNFEWRSKWTHDTCNSPMNRAEVYGKMNLHEGSIDYDIQKRWCAVTMEHLDVWHDIVNRNISLALILEDDAVFVPFFREKFDRTIYTAIRTGALKIGMKTKCVKLHNTHLPPDSNEWNKQDPVIVIGSCFDTYDTAFLADDKNAEPILSTHKALSARCSHAYLLTTCSARALLRQIATQKNKFLQTDSLLNELVAVSPTLQAFWLDPPIVYQGNMINDLDDIPSFKRATYC